MCIRDRSQVDLLPLPLHLIGAQDLLGGGGEQVLEQIHHVVEIGVGLVEDVYKRQDWIQAGILLTVNVMFQRLV